MLKIVDISVGHNVNVGWHEETTYNEGINVGTSFNGAANINRVGIVTDFTVTPAVTRHHTYGLGSQTRTNDPILEINYDWSLTAIWQTSQADDTIYQFVNHVVTNYTVALWNSYCFRINAVPDGVAANAASLYLEGAVVQTISIKLSVGDVVTVTMSGFAAAVYTDNWVLDTANEFPAATDVPAVVATDPTAWHIGDAAAGTFGTIVDISARMQEFTVDINFNCPKIPGFASGENVMSGPGALEVSCSGTYYGDGTSMGVGSVLSDMQTGLATLVIDIDALTDITLTAFSMDNMSFPFKEKELIIMTFDGKANSCTVA